MLRDRKILIVLSVTTLASFMTGFNARLAVVGLPTIASEINADIWSIVWIIQGFMLGSTIIQLVIGRLSDLYGRVRLFNYGIIVFTLGALFSGLCNSPHLLIISRLLQGIGSAFLMTLSITILTDNVPLSSLGTWLGINQVSWRVGALFGLTLSGVIIQFLGWKWIFLIQVPVGLIAFYWSTKHLSETYRPSERVKIDWAGFLTFTLSLSLILISLTLMGYGYFSMSTILLVAGLVLFVVFTILELKTDSPALDLRLFKIWQFSGGIIAQFLYAIGFGASLTLLAIYMQSVMGFNPFETGILLVPYEMGYLFFGILGGRLSDKYGFTYITILGLSIASASLFLFSIVNSLNLLIISEILFGVGTGLFVSPNTSSIMSSVPPQRRGVASSIRTISFNLGFAVSLNLAIFTITQKIPYGIASQLIIIGGTIGKSAFEIYELGELGSAIRYSFLVQSAVMALAIPFSLARRTKAGKNKAPAYN